VNGVNNIAPREANTHDRSSVAETFEAFV